MELCCGPCPCEGSGRYGVRYDLARRRTVPHRKDARYAGFPKRGRRENIAMWGQLEAQLLSERAVQLCLGAVHKKSLRRGWAACEVYRDVGALRLLRQLANRTCVRNDGAPLVSMEARHERCRKRVHAIGVDGDLVGKLPGRPSEVQSWPYVGYIPNSENSSGRSPALFISMT